VSERGRGYKPGSNAHNSILEPSKDGTEGTTNGAVGHSVSISDVIDAQPNGVDHEHGLEEREDVVMGDDDSELLNGNGEGHGDDQIQEQLAMEMAGSNGSL
jgi:hypothetical protein